MERAESTVCTLHLVRTIGQCRCGAQGFPPSREWPRFLAIRLNRVAETVNGSRDGERMDLHMAVDALMSYDGDPVDEE